MSFKLGSNSVINLSNVDDRLVDIIEVALTLTSVDFGIPSTAVSYTHLTLPTTPYV